MNSAMRRASEAGHEIGNHTFDHPHLNELDEQAVRDELEGTAALIEAHTGRAPRLVRCPYGDDEQRLSELAADHGLEAVIHWSINPEDWSDPAPETIARRVLEEAEPGAIVCLHDGDGRSNTARALATIVPELLERGFELVTVSELLASAASAPVPNRWQVD